MDEVARLYDVEGRRKFLLEMATGTGKMLLCAAVIRQFLTTRNAERVLFIVDRIELAKQTMEDFGVVLQEFKPVIFKTARRTGELLGSSVVVATIQSLMVDRRYREEFTPFHFDLVINDDPTLMPQLITQLLDTENHGKTPAFMTAYDIQFAKLAELQEEERQKKKARCVHKNHHHIEGLSATGARKNIFTQIPKEPDADILFGAVWYEDPILNEEHYSRFILRINATRDIPGHGLTRLDVDGVSKEYWSSDYQKKEQE